MVIDAIDDSSDLVPMGQSFRASPRRSCAGRVLFDLMVIAGGDDPHSGRGPDDYGANAENALCGGGQGRRRG
jgi:hypothetical protein